MSGKPVFFAKLGADDTNGKTSLQAGIRRILISIVQVEAYPYMKGLSRVAVTASLITSAWSVIAGYFHGQEDRYHYL